MWIGNAGLSSASARLSLRFHYASTREPEWRPYAVREPCAASSKSEAIGMADVMFLAIGGGAFVAFAALAVLLKRV